MQGSPADQTGRKGSQAGSIEPAVATTESGAPARPIEVTSKVAVAPVVVARCGVTESPSIEARLE